MFPVYSVTYVPGCSTPLLPSSRVSTTVHDRRYCDERRIDNVEHRIREPMHESSPRLSLDDPILLRVSFDALEHPRHLGKVFAPQPWALALVPLECLA